LKEWNANKTASHRDQLWTSMADIDFSDCVYPKKKLKENIL